MNKVACALAIRKMSKAFPGVQALDNTDLTVERGEIHGLVGENGAGKSTIIKVLAGVYQADTGTIAIGDEPISAVTPQSVHDLGVRFIHQELSLVPHFNVAESVFMGQELSGKLDLSKLALNKLGLAKREMRHRAERFLNETLGTKIDARTLIRDLTVAQRKLVQIARALIDGNAQLVVFDEPTAVLASDDIDTLFAAIRGLRSQGISMIYVSHYLSEILEICDRVTVFRDGTDIGVVDLAKSAKSAGSVESAGSVNFVESAESVESVNSAGSVKSVETGDLIAMMVGREINNIYPDRTTQTGDEIFSASGLSDGAHFNDINFAVGSGEIVGIAGITGSGRDELVDSIYGIRKSRGTVKVDGLAVSLHQPADAINAGLVLVPRDRRSDGLILDMTVNDNINIATLDEISTAGWINRSAATERSDQLVDQLDVRPKRSSTVVRFLSGGNQQKVVLARWLATDSKVFVLDDPTVGVDVGARSEIYKLVAELASDGAGVIVSSDDLSELVGICDRVLVMVRGRIVADRTTEGLELEELIAVTTSTSDTTSSTSDTTLSTSDTTLPL